MATTRHSNSRRKSSSSTKRAGSRTTGSRKKGTRTRGSASSAHTRRTSAHTAHKTGRKTAHGQAWTDAHSEHPSSTGHGKAKKEPAKQTSRCWPGYEPVRGKARGEKGSCRPKARQTAAERKSDGMAAAASKLRKAGGSKSRANRSH